MTRGTNVRRMAINTVADILRTHAAERPDDVALVLDERTVTWAELLRAGQPRRRRARRRWRR